MSLPLFPTLLPPAPAAGAAPKHHALTRLLPHALACCRRSYSYGIVLWELVTRERPFGNLPDFQIIYAVCEHQTRPIIPEDFPPALVALVTDCWKVEPSDRPTFKAILRSLRSAELDIVRLGDSETVPKADPPIQDSPPGPVSSPDAAGPASYASVTGHLVPPPLMAGAGFAESPGSSLSSNNSATRPAPSVGSVRALETSQRDWSRAIKASWGRIPTVDPAVAQRVRSDTTNNGAGAGGSLQLVLGLGPGAVGGVGSH